MVDQKASASQVLPFLQGLQDLLKKNIPEEDSSFKSYNPNPNDKEMIDSKNHYSEFTKSLGAIEKNKNAKKEESLAKVRDVILNESKSYETRCSKMGAYLKKYHDTVKEKDILKKEKEKIVDSIKELEKKRNNLQKQNQDLIAENQKIIEDQKSKRDKLIADLQERCKTINKNLEEQEIAKKQELRENALLKEKYDDLTQKLEKRDQIFEKEMSLKGNDIQKLEETMDSKLKLIEEESKINFNHDQEFEKLNKNIEKLKELTHSYEQKNEEYQEIMDKTNDFFAYFKKQMEFMTKKMRTLDEENSNEIKRIEKFGTTFCQQLEEHTRVKKQIEGIEKNISALINLQNSLKSKLPNPAQSESQQN